MKVLDILILFVVVLLIAASLILITILNNPQALQLLNSLGIIDHTAESLKSLIIIIMYMCIIAFILVIIVIVRVIYRLFFNSKYN
ncbi:hypothetical protein ABSA28_00024 [Candidatus Hepatincolaceae symbiont of Richtersius coronifer]